MPFHFNLILDHLDPFTQKKNKAKQIKNIWFLNSINEKKKTTAPTANEWFFEQRTITATATKLSYKKTHAQCPFSV